jgi:Xaa-Pro aminopeptidase
MKTALCKLLEQIENKDADINAALITLPANIKYYSGFTGDKGVLFVHSLVCYLITDSSYVEHAKKQCPEFKIVNAKECKVMDFLSGVCSKLGIHSILFEEEHIPSEYYQTLKDSLNDVQLIPDKGMLSHNRMGTNNQ